MVYHDQSQFYSADYKLIDVRSEVIMGHQGDLKLLYASAVHPVIHIRITGMKDVAVPEVATGSTD